MQRVFLFFLILTISGVANAQSITNVKARQEDKKIIVSYDITGVTAGMLYDVKLFVSEDGGNNWEGPMTEITSVTSEQPQGRTGDPGIVMITDGTSKQIIWDVLNEPGREQLIGNKIAFKIQAILLSGQSASGTASGTPCPGVPTITDPRDGQVYPTVKIGSQCWLQKNMNYQTGNSWCYENQAENCNIYGRLYDWETALRVCPKGWHLPSDDEWSVLLDYLGGKSVVGGKMKSKSGWENDGNGTNTSGFTALPGGVRDDPGSFYNLGFNAHFWSVSQCTGTDAWGRFLGLDEDVVQYLEDKTFGLSCRCLQY